MYTKNGAEFENQGCSALMREIMCQHPYMYVKVGISYTESKDTCIHLIANGADRVL
jgi:hypothetical protein